MNFPRFLSARRLLHPHLQVLAGVAACALSSLLTTSAAQAQTALDAPETIPVPAATPLPPPTAQAYVRVSPGFKVSYGHTMVPLNWLSTGLGASTGRVGEAYRIVYFGHTIDLYAYQVGARFDGRQTQFPVAPQNFGGTFYVPWTPIAKLLGVTWKRVPLADGTPNTSLLLLQYPAAYIENVRSQISPEKVRVVMELSNPTRIVASQQKLDVRFALAAARREGVPAVKPIGDYLVARGVTQSGNWAAKFGLHINYAAPVQWFTLDNPPRLVIDVQRLFEERNTSPIGGGLKMTKIRRGLDSGPVQMYVVKVDPREGWRMKVAPGGYSVLQRNRPSRIASRHKALVAVNGGFFAYDGAAVGAVLSNGEWIRLPWKGRTGVGFRPDGQARIGFLQARARVEFSNGHIVPIRDLNGWPDSGKVSALNSRFGTYYKLRAGEMAIEVRDGIVVAKPGGGGVKIHPNGFTLIASGGARPALEGIARGAKAQLQIDAPGWEGITTALGGGPRLVVDGRVDVTALREDFRNDVRVGRGPRTAFGLDKDGNYLLCVVDGRQPNHSVGLTLTELAHTMQKMGAVNAMNLDGGGSTALAVRSRIVNRPSDGRERAVSNALLVMR